jgi:hypothetical protein
MPITKALKVNTVITRFMRRTLDKWRNLTTGTSVESGTNPTTDGVPFEVRSFRQAERHFDGKSGSR